METLQPDQLQIDAMKAKQEAERSQAQDVAHELHGLSLSATMEAATVVEAGDPNKIESEIGNYASTQEVKKVGRGILKVTQFNTVSNGYSPEDEVSFDRIPTSDKSLSEVKEFTAPAKGILGSKPDMESAQEDRTSRVVLRSRNLRVGRKNLESTFHEDVNGEVRDVSRTVDVGTDSDGNPEITVTQVSTDKNGENPRERTWKHTQDKPSEVALKTAQRVGRRVADKQPKNPDTEIRL
jgi:hypothetical protein